MLFGHNTDVKLGQVLYHVQTEDRGVSHAMIDTTVYYGGRVLHRRTKAYSDLLPLDADREQKLRQRLNAQHQAVLEELRSGALKLPQHGPPSPPPPPSTDGKSAASPAPSSLGVTHSIALELLNAKNWLSGKRATLQISVFQKEGGNGVSGAHVTARIDGAAEPAQFSTATGLDGNGQLAFDMPRLAAAECALVIEATHGQARASLRFQLRAKPRVPAAG